MKEPAGYRAELEEILRFFEDKHLLTISDVSRYTGKCRAKTKELWFGEKKEITASALAMALSK